MQQRRSLEELHRRRGSDDGVSVRPTAGPVTPVEKGRPKTLSTLQQGTHSRDQRVELVADLGQDARLG